MSIPTSGEQFAILIEHLRKAQEAASMLAHLERDHNKLQSQGWMGVSEMLKKTAHAVTKIAMGKMQ